MQLRSVTSKAARVAAVLAVAGLVFTVPTATEAQAGAVATSKYVSVSPTRLLDTRIGLGAPKALPAVGSMVDLKVTGVGGVPATGVTAVTLNVTVTDPQSSGYVQVLPTGSGAAGKSSNINVYGLGQTAANVVTVPVGTGGKVSLYDVAGGHLIADVQGYFVQTGATSDGRYVAVTPTRLLDSRDRTGMASLAPTNPGDVKNCSDFGSWSDANTWFWKYFPSFGDVAKLDGNNDRIPCESLPGNPGHVVQVPGPDPFPMPRAGATIKLQVTGRGGVPTAGVSSVALTVTATGSAAAGYVQVVPTAGSTALGSTSNVNVTGPGQTVANLVIVPLGTGGTVQLYNSSGTDIIADVVGYFTNASAASSDAGLFVPLTPGRLADTRSGAIASAGSETTLTPAGRAGLPTSDMSAIFLNVTATGTTGAGYLQVFPTGRGTRGASSSVNYTGAGQTVATAAVAGLGNAGKLSVYTPTQTHVILDVAGYFTTGSSLG